MDDSDERLSKLKNSLTDSLEQLNSLIDGEVDNKLSQQILLGLKQGLREFPKLLSTIVPEKSVHIVEDLEHQIKKQFSEF